MNSSDVFAKNPRVYKIQKIVFTTLTYLFLVFVAVIILIPFYWMLLTSVKSTSMIQRVPPLLWVPFKDWVLTNYTGLFALDRYGVAIFPFFTYLKNTVLVALITTAGTALTTILAAFAFARLHFKGRDTVFAILLGTMMVPGEIFILTNFLTINKFGWYNVFNQTYTDAILAMTIPFMTSVFYTFYLRQTFKQIPNELYFAAKVDGTGDFGYLWKIMVPVASPTIVTILILNAMGTWSAYIWPVLVTAKSEYRLVSNALRGTTFMDNAGIVQYGQQMAAATLVTVPLLIIFFIFRKQIMRGVSRSGIKG